MVVDHDMGVLFCVPLVYLPTSGVLHVWVRGHNKQNMCCVRGTAVTKITFCLLCEASALLRDIYDTHGALGSTAARATRFEDSTRTVASFNRI